VLAPPELPDVSPNAFLSLLALGFVIAVAGHVYGSRSTIALGLILIVMAVVVLPLIALATAGG
jgi:hypothetical protein